MNRLITLIVGLLALWALFEFGGRTQAPVIQADIQSRTEAALDVAGLDDVVVSADGLDVSLSGTVSEDAEVGQAGDVATAVRGVHSVENAVTVAVYFTQFCKDDSRILLTGNVSDEDARTAFPERAQDMFRYWEIEQDLVINDNSPNGFRRFMDHALIELGQLDAGCITLNNRALSVSGSVRSERTLAGIKARFDDLSDLGFTVSYDLRLPELSEQALACQEEANRHVQQGETVLFDFDSDVIHTDGQQLLDEVVEISKLCPDVHVLVTGHTDSIGDKDYNIALGERRAEAVVTYMVSKGVDAGRLTPVGLGFSQPIADNSTEEGRSQNRRIEFRAREE
jgi:OOP family OmpA-OmpF porin